jgi:hypothetical protein
MNDCDYSGESVPVCKELWSGKNRFFLLIFSFLAILLFIQFYGLNRISPLINSTVIEKMHLYIQIAAEKGIMVIPINSNLSYKYKKYIHHYISIMNNIMSYFLPSHFNLRNPSKEGLSALLLI